MIKDIKCFGWVCEYFESVTIIFKGLVESHVRNRNCLEYNSFSLHKCSYDNTLEHLRKTKMNRYWPVVCYVFRLTWQFSLFSGKLPFSSDKLNKSFRVSLIFPKPFLATLKFMPLYPGLCLFSIRRKLPLIQLLIVFFIIPCVWFKKLVYGFEKFGTFLTKFGPRFVNKVNKRVCYNFCSGDFFICNSQRFK